MVDGTWEIDIVESQFAAHGENPNSSNVAQPTVQHPHQARLAATPRAEDPKSQRSEAALGTNVCQHLDVGAKSEEIIKTFFVRPHRFGRASTLSDYHNTF